MKLGIRFRIFKFDDTGLTYAHRFFEQELRIALNYLDKFLTEQAQSRMRKDTGLSKKTLKGKIEGRGINLRLKILSNNIRAIVDALGIRAGKVFPNWRPGSNLFKWAYRKTRRDMIFLTDVKKFKSKKAKRVPKIKHIKQYGRKDHRRKNRFNAEGLNMAFPKRSDQYGGVTYRVKQFHNARRLAYNVARKIYFKGIQPTYWHRETMRANRNVIIREISTAIQKAVGRINRG